VENARLISLPHEGWWLLRMKNSAIKTGSWRIGMARSYNGVHCCQWWTLRCPFKVQAL